MARYGVCGVDLSGGTHEQVVTLIAEGCVSALCSVFEHPDNRLQLVRAAVNPWDPRLIYKYNNKFQTISAR